MCGKLTLKFSVVGLIRGPDGHDADIRSLPGRENEVRVGAFCGESRGERQGGSGVHRSLEVGLEKVFGGTAQGTISLEVLIDYLLRMPQ
jgi:hypothetical protein